MITAEMLVCLPPRLESCMAVEELCVMRFKENESFLRGNHYLPVYGEPGAQ